MSWPENIPCRGRKNQTLPICSKRHRTPKDRHWQNPDFDYDYPGRPSALPGILTEVDRLKLGLLVNELVTNARKHALDEGGLLQVRLRRQDHEVVVLELANSGRPLPEHIEPTAAASMGMQLITSLAAQLGGTVRAERGALTCFVAELRLPA